MMSLRWSVAALSLTLLVMSGADAHAQKLAPTPRSAPRIPVRHEVLPGSKEDPVLTSRILAGRALVLDSERLKIDSVEVRLFGVVPPQMSASYGPQARAVVDALTQGTVSCRVRDRERNGSYLATCQNDAQADFGMELLRRGLAIAARGSLQGSELAASYIAAEQAAQTQRLGFWSTKTPAGVSQNEIRDAAAEIKAAAEAKAKAEAARKEAEKAEAEAKAARDQAEKAKAEMPAATTGAKGLDALAIPATALMPAQAPAAEVKPPVPPARPEEKPANIGMSAEDVQAFFATPVATASADEAAQSVVTDDTRSLAERYQILLAGGLLLLTVIVGAGAFVMRGILDRRDAMRSLAAALRGEMMAMRAICLGRLAKLAHEPDGASFTWPRLRALVFQAYIGRLGDLGADLSRQIASIYGQASDYASYYTSNGAQAETAAKKHSLQTLVHHIDEVTPRLNLIEETGRLAAQHHAPSLQPLISRIARLIEALPHHRTPPSGGGSGGKPSTLPVPKESTQEAKVRSAVSSLAKAKAEIVAEDAVPPARAARPSQTVVSKADILKNAQAIVAPVNSGKDETFHPAPEDQEASETSQAATASADNKADAASPIRDKLAKLRAKVADRVERLRPRLEEGMIPDYANLTDEELEALAYAEEYLYGGAGERYRKVG